MKAVIFDYGGVLCLHPPDAQVNELARLTGLSREEFLRVYWSNRHGYDRADFTPDGYWKMFAEACGKSYTPEQVQEFRRCDVGFWVHLHDGMVDYARRVRAAGFRTAVLSNLPYDLGEHMRAHMPLLKEFDHHTFSYELRAAKPEAAIYEHCVKGLGVPANETVFIDDRPENVEGARAYGLRAILFESPRQLQELTRDADDLVALRSTPVILE